MQTITQMSKKSIAAIIFSVLLVLSLFMSYLSTPVVGADTGDDKVVLGYYASWAPPADDFDPNKITHLNYSFGDICMDSEHGNPLNEEITDGGPKTWACTDLEGNVDEEIEDGTIVLYEPELDLVELANVEKLKEQNPDLKTLLSIGGWTLSHNLSDVAADEEMRATLANSAVDFIREFNMDGLDVDWEWPGYEGGHEGNSVREGEDGDNYVKLLQDVRDAFDVAGEEDGKDYLVTIAGAQTWAFDENNDLTGIGEIVDYAAIMTYDTNGVWSGLTGHNAPVYLDDLEEEYRGWHSGSAHSASDMYRWKMPVEKIVLGVPFYGQAWGGCNVEDDGVYQSERGAYQECAPKLGEDGVPASLESNGYDNIKSLVNKDGYKYYWDNVAKAPYLYNESKQEFVSYDNKESLQYKVNLVKEKGLGGIMIWDIGTDDADWTLLKTVSEGLGVSEEAPTSDPEQPGFNIADLEMLIEEAQAISNEEGTYTADTFASLQDAINVAVAALETIESEEELEASLASLQSAIDGLEEGPVDPVDPVEPVDPVDPTDPEEVVDLAGLEMLITEAQALSNEEGTYTAETFASLQGAIEEAVAALETIETEEDLAASLASLQLAIDGLKVVEVPKENEVVIEEDNDETPVVEVDEDKNGNKLPATATNMFNLLVAGFVVIALGTTMFFIQRRKKNITE